MANGWSFVKKAPAVGHPCDVTRGDVIVMKLVSTLCVGGSREEAVEAPQVSFCCLSLYSVFLCFSPLFPSRLCCQPVLCDSVM